MSVISIIYYSGAGHTQKIAESVKTGIESVKVATANLIQINGEDMQKGR
jgi:NAD(P)H dehydrogenase (quinone)